MNIVRSEMRDSRKNIVRKLKRRHKERFNLGIFIYCTVLYILEKEKERNKSKVVCVVLIWFKREGVKVLGKPLIPIT